jgi:ADP-heptose:LPS heptosyltransferase
MSKSFSKTIILSKVGSEYLYEDFAEVIPYKGKLSDQTCTINNRGFEQSQVDLAAHGITLAPGDKYVSGLQNLASYRWKVVHQHHAFNSQDFVPYGVEMKSEMCDILIHARSTNKCDSDYKNWPKEKWGEFISSLPPDLKVGCIGTKQGAAHIKGTKDYRGLNLRKQCALIANSRVVVGPASGPIVLASLCKTNNVTWYGDPWHEVNSYRHTKHWNPFLTAVNVFRVPNWNPEVSEVRKRTLSSMGVVDTVVKEDKKTGEKKVKKTSERVLNITVPSGIGDIAWVFQKIQGEFKRINVKICGGEPRRSLEFVKLLKGVGKVEYTNASFEQVNRDRVNDRNDLERHIGDDICISANTFLEAGNMIADFLGDKYPVKYNLNYNKFSPKRLAVLNKLTGKKLIGVYMSSYKTNENWNCLSEDDWVKLIGRLQKKYKKHEFVLIGAEFDTDMGQAVYEKLIKRKGANKVKVSNMIGKTHISATIALLRMLDGFISFPSGLGILASMEKIPTIMFMPEHLTGLQYTWVDPEWLETEKFSHMPIGTSYTKVYNRFTKMV